MLQEKWKIPSNPAIPWNIDLAGWPSAWLHGICSRMIRLALSDAFSLTSVTLPNTPLVTGPPYKFHSLKTTTFNWYKVRLFLRMRSFTHPCSETVFYHCGSTLYYTVASFFVSLYVRLYVSMSRHIDPLNFCKNKLVSHFMGILQYICLFRLFPLFQ